MLRLNNYDGIHVGTRRADFIVENDIIVELKALINLEDEHLAQAKNYINFGATSLQIKKVINKKYNLNPENPKIK